MRKYPIYILFATCTVMSFSACSKKNVESDPSALIGSNQIEDSSKENEGDNTVGVIDEDIHLDVGTVDDQVNGSSDTENTKLTVEDSTVSEDTTSDDSTVTNDTSITPKPVKERSKEMYVVLKDYGSVVKVREGAGTDTKELGILVHAEKVYVIKTEGDWSQIFYKDGYGYCMTKFLTDQKPAYLTPKPVKKSETGSSTTPATTTEPTTAGQDTIGQETTGQDTTGQETNNPEGGNYENELPPEI